MRRVFEEPGREPRRRPGRCPRPRSFSVVLVCDAFNCNFVVFFTCFILLLFFLAFVYILLCRFFHWFFLYIASYSFISSFFVVVSFLSFFAFFFFLFFFPCPLLCFLSFIIPPIFRYLQLTYIFFMYLVRVIVSTMAPFTPIP